MRFAEKIVYFPKNLGREKRKKRGAKILGVPASRCNFGALGGNKIRGGAAGWHFRTRRGWKKFRVFLARNISSASSVMRIGAIREDRWTRSKNSPPLDFISPLPSTLNFQLSDGRLFRLFSQLRDLKSHCVAATSRRKEFIITIRLSRKLSPFLCIIENYYNSYPRFLFPIFLFSFSKEKSKETWWFRDEIFRWNFFFFFVITRGKEEQSNLIESNENEMSNLRAHKDEAKNATNDEPERGPSSSRRREETSLWSWLLHRSFRFMLPPLRPWNPDKR